MKKNYQKREFTIDPDEDTRFAVTLIKHSLNHHIRSSIHLHKGRFPSLTIFEGIGLDFDDMEQKAEIFIEKYMKENEIKIEE
jgi:hypothetical protein